MKITEVKTYVVAMPWKNWLFVEVHTDEGITGIGEATVNAFARTVEAKGLQQSQSRLYS